MRMLYRIVVIILLTFLFVHSYGQPVNREANNKTCCSDSSHFLKAQLVTVGLISGGILIESANIKKEIQGWFPRTNTHVEDYLRDVPVGMLYVSDVFGCKHRNNAFNQTIYLIISRLATGYLTGAIKKITNLKRPNGENLAFPSGHTSEAFVSATFLYNETIDYDPYLAYSGYLFSAATGVLRITNNKHWISDVLVGAGLGMFITNLVYYIEPFKNWDPFRLNNKAEIIPDIDIDSGTFYVSARIKFK
jgi:membrane-associated phospholipid phosphatase